MFLKKGVRLLWVQFWWLHGKIGAANCNGNILSAKCLQGHYFFSIYINLVITFSWKGANYMLSHTYLSIRNIIYDMRQLIQDHTMSNI